MEKRKRRPFFENKSCDLCGEKAILFRCIDDKHYFLCNTRKCDFIVRIKHNRLKTIIGK